MDRAWMCEGINDRSNEIRSAPMSRTAPSGDLGWLKKMKSLSFRTRWSTVSWKAIRSTVP